MAERDPDREKEPEEVKRGRAFAEVRDHGYIEAVYDQEDADARLRVLGVGHLVNRIDPEIDEEMNDRNIFGRTRLEEDFDGS